MMMKRRSRRHTTVSMGWVAAACVLAVAEVGKAAEEDVSSGSEVATSTSKDAEEMVVMGRRIRRNLSAETSDAAFVVSREEIELSQQFSLVDVLRDLPGLTVQSSGGPGSETDLRIRGADSTQVQVIIDGVRVGSATTGDFNWANLPSAAIERVEVIRGPQSALFGANAVGGVILIETKRGRRPTRLVIEGGYGSHRQSLASASLSGETDFGARYSFTASRNTIDAISAVTRPAIGSTTVEDDAYRNIAGFGQVSFPVGEGEFRFGARITDSKLNFDDGSRDNPNRDQDTREHQVDLGLVYPITDKWSTRIVVARYALDREGRDPTDRDNEFDIETTSWQANWVNEVDVFGFGLLSGIDFEQERGDSASGGFDRSAEQAGFFARIETPSAYAIGLNGGVRYEVNSISNDQATYQLGLTVRVADLDESLRAVEGLEFRANYGTGYRPPSLNELFFTSAFAIPNPALRPERSEGVDAGLSFARDFDCGIDFSADLWGFYQRYENLIEFTGFPSQPVNINRARVWGFEASTQISWEWFRFAASWTHLNSEDGDGFRLRRRPLDAGRVSFGVAHEGYEANLAVRAVAQSYSRTRQRDQTGAYVVVDLGASAEIYEGIRFKGNVRNLFDEDYEQIFRRGTLGRTFFASVEIAL